MLCYHPGTEPAYLGTRQLIGLALLRGGKHEAALDAIQQESNEGYRLIGLAIAYHALGRLADSDAAIGELIEKYEHEAAYNIAFILAFKDDTDRAFAWLDKAVQNYDPGLAEIAVEPLFQNLHPDPRWQPFLNTIGKSKEQLERIQFRRKLPS